jgi:transposase-like protein
LSQFRSAETFLLHSDILAETQILERCRALMENTVVEAGLIVVGSLLEISARSLTGAPHQGRGGGEYVRHGRQDGAVYLAGSKVRLRRPRVRSKAGKEAKIPAYEVLSSSEEAGKKVMRAAVAGVSTRKYGKAIEDAATAVGVSKSNLSRKLVEETGASLKALLERPVPEGILAIVMDGVHMGEQVVLIAVGIDSQGVKHPLGLADGGTENAQVAGDLLSSLVERGLDVSQKILFLLDGGKALRAAVHQVCGHHHEIQRCREHKIRNVTDRVPKAKVTYVRSFMRAAWKLSPDEGIAKMRQLAKELGVSHPDAARSVLEGLEDSFTVNRLGLPPLLVASLQSTNIGESLNSTLRVITGRIKNFQSGNDQALRWAATAVLEAEKSFRAIKGHKQLWMLAASLGRKLEEQAV